MKSNRFLKKGYTTGSCAAAAAKAAVMTVLNDEIVITTQITLPKGESINIDITDTQIDGDSVTCTVKKYSGDDPDITNGILVCATVRKNSGGIKIDGGVGVGRVTRNGLDQPVGNAAINSVPRQMIRNSINEICGDYDGTHRKMRKHETAVRAVPHTAVSCFLILRCVASCFQLSL